MGRPEAWSGAKPQAGGLAQPGASARPGLALVQRTLRPHTADIAIETLHEPGPYFAILA